LADQYKNRTGPHTPLAASAPQAIPGGQTIVAGAGQHSLVGEQLERTLGADDDDEQRFMDAPSGPASIGATMDFSAAGPGAGQTLAFAADQAATLASLSTGMRQSKSDLTAQMERLDYVCRLLNKARRPVVPVNGILVTV